MSGKTTDTKVAHQIELAIRRLESLSTLPCTAAQFLSQLVQFELTPSSLDEIIEADPALMVKIFQLIHQQGLSFADEDYSLSQVLDHVSLRQIRDAFLRVEVYQAFGQNDIRTELRKQLIRHGLAVACCAEDIAEMMSPKANPQLAYHAGLLHNIGNLALDEAMPRSFASIIEEAKSQNASICAIEQKRLGLDYTIIGKRLAQKWHVPEQITLAIWLHQSDTVTISQTMPEARTAQIIQLANLIARQCGIGQSGSYDLPVSPNTIAKGLAISPEQLQQIRQNLDRRVAQKSKVLGLDLPNVAAAYSSAVQTTAAELAQDNTKLSLENRQLQRFSSHFRFTADFLSSINSTSGPVEVAENFAARWQKFYQTGPVCIYLTPAKGVEEIEAVVVESQSQTKTVILSVPADSVPTLEAAAKDFAVLNAQDCVDWLFEQLDVDFDLSRTKLVPLLSNGKAVGAVVFELRYPTEAEKLEENFKAISSIAGAVLNMAFAWQKQQGFAEQFARFLGRARETQREAEAIPQEQAIPPQPVSAQSLAALAEMAAGAAHELNNPLSVISGRAELLSEGETDEEKKNILKQIQENTSEISQIIDDLLSFAEPPAPKSAETDIKQMLDEAIQLASQKTKVERIDVQVEVAGEVESVFVDSGQVVSAIANVISNSVESYGDEAGPIKVTALPQEPGDSIQLQIVDKGCGMDAETVQKATQPFFSARPAGRKRGMGLAYAARLIQLNGGSLSIESQPAKGTTVTITLPRK